MESRIFIFFLRKKDDSVFLKLRAQRQGLLALPCKSIFAWMNGGIHEINAFVMTNNLFKRCALSSFLIFFSSPQFYCNNSLINKKKRKYSINIQCDIHSSPREITFYQRDWYSKGCSYRREVEATNYIRGRVELVIGQFEDTE